MSNLSKTLFYQSNFIPLNISIWIIHRIPTPTKNQQHKDQSTTRFNSSKLKCTISSIIASFHFKRDKASGTKEGKLLMIYKIQIHDM